MKYEVNDLINGYLDETLSNEQFDHLQNWIKQDPRNADRFARAIHLDNALEAETVANPYKTGEINVQQIQNAIAESNPPSGRTNRRFIWSSIAVSFCVLLSIGLAIYLFNRDQSNLAKEKQPGVEEVESEAFATLTQSIDTVWEKDQVCKVNDRLTDQTIQLKSGTIQIEFDDGVEVTLEGPAEYRLIAPGKTKLLSGLLTATVPPGAEGFEVDTPNAKVIDLGTSFGIDLLGSQAGSLVVFDGEVEVMDRSGNQKQLLKEGEAVNLDMITDKTSSDIDTSRFAKIWPIASGIVGSDGEFRFAPPFPRRLNLVESDTQVFVFPESYAPKVIEESIAVDITKPGEYRFTSQLEETKIPAGSRIRSALLLFNPVTDDDFPFNRRQFKRIVGSITFDRPVVGLIVTDDKLFASDGLFSRRTEMLPPMFRELELPGPRLGDIISLSEDRRTVTLDLISIGRNRDHIRVLFDASYSGNSKRFERTPNWKKQNSNAKAKFRNQ